MGTITPASAPLTAGLSAGALISGKTQLANLHGWLLSMHPQASRAGAPQRPIRTVSQSILLLGSLFPYVDGWAIVMPIPLTLEHDEDGALVLSDNIFNMYGSGHTIREAMKDYVTALVGLYEIIRRDVLAGVPYADEELQALSAYLVRR